ncbi:MAG: GTP 3',8-cyclase MoaA [Alicyclobacillaceae bacterium]|nr:GTP 3',8-cyclase MoaA [Alicyclobacillaceae bacterium]
MGPLVSLSENIGTGRLVDRFGRVHDYLRISVTDRCNLRCLYCMPAEGVQFMDSGRLMTDEEIVRVVRVAARLGVRRLRITGGEPLVRPGIDRLIEALGAIPGIEDMAMTTNGVLLARRAERLRRAGLRRINISIDSLRPDRFAVITRGGDLSRVLEGLKAAERAGMSPIKINVVLLKGFNEDEIDDFLRLSIEKPYVVRFIEYMPIGHEDETWKNAYLPLRRVLDRCEELGYEIEPVQVPGNGPAENWRIRGGLGAFGLIHPVSEHFCAACNRLRLTADGYLKPCLYWQEEFNVRRCGGDEKAIEELFFRALDIKPERHEMAEALEGKSRSHTPTVRRMSQIGG